MSDLPTRTTGRPCSVKRQLTEAEIVAQLAAKGLPPSADHPGRGWHLCDCGNFHPNP